MAFMVVRMPDGTDWFHGRAVSSKLLAMAIVFGAGACGGNANTGSGSASVHEPDAGAGARPDRADGASASGGTTGGAGNGGNGGTTAASNAGTASVSGNCETALSESGCPATYDDALGSIQCTPDSRRTWALATCGALRSFRPIFLGASQTCIYGESGFLVGSRTCSKPISGCNCFVGGVTLDGCAAVAIIDPCDMDAGIDTD